MKIKKLICLGILVTVMLNLLGCSFPELFYKTPTLEEATDQEIQTTVTMPDLSGLTYKQAVQKSDNIPLIITKQYNNKIKNGKIFWQSVEPNTEISIGTSVDVIISKGIQRIKIPKISNMDYLAAITVLKSLGFKVKINYDYQYGSNEILSISPKDGKETYLGSTVNLTVDSEKK